ncbi:amidase family protein [Mycoplasma sp. Z386]
MIKNKGNFLLAHKELHKDTNNAVSFLFPEQEIIENKALSGCVFTIKDVFATKTAKTQASSRLLENFYPSYNATVVQKLLDNGAIPVAKVHNDELALGGEGIYSYWGIISHPLDNKRKIGGSSSGSAATLTNNVSFALASDTGDSVRLPASYIGKVGFKPSYGAVSRFGMFAYASSLDTVSWFAHNVNDVIEVAKVAYGKDYNDMTSENILINNVIKTKPDKIGYFNIPKNLLSESVYEKYFSFIKEISAFVETESIEPNADLLKAIKPVYEIISYSEASSNLANLNGIAFGQRENGKDWSEIMTNTRSKGFGKMVQRRLILGSYFLEKENQDELFLKAQKIRRLIKNYLDELYDKYDIVIYPAAPDVAPYFENAEKRSYMDYILTGSNLAGSPSITMKLGVDKNNKLPFNLAIDSKMQNDEKLLSYALWIEEKLKEKTNE